MNLIRKISKIFNIRMMRVHFFLITLLLFSGVVTASETRDEGINNRLLFQATPETDNIDTESRLLASSNANHFGLLPSKSRMGNLQIFPQNVGDSSKNSVAQFNEKQISEHSFSMVTQDISISYIDFAPILITDNGDFHSDASSYGWDLGSTRDGSSMENAYVISNYNIVGSPTDPRIEIRNTDLYFQIIDCVLAGGADDGIFLDNVVNGNITQNIIANNTNGIYCYSTNNCSFSNNYVQNNDVYGLRMRSSSANNIFNNTIEYNGDNGIQLSFSSSFNTFWDNTVSNNARYGIYVYSSEYNTFSTNSVSNNEFGGIWLVEGSSNNQIFSNTIHDNPYGIYIDNFLNNIAVHNTISNNTLFNCEAGCAITIFASDYSTVTNNHIYDSPGGINVAMCKENDICENLIYDNSGVGIWLYVTNNNYLDDNEIYNNSAGIYGSSSDNNMIKSNTIYNNQISAGIELVISSNNQIINNTIYDHDSFTYLDCFNDGDCQYGIFLDRSDDTRITDNTLYNNMFGVYVLSSTNGSIIHNTLYDNYGGTGITLYYSEDTFVSSNECQDNGYSGIAIVHSENNVVFNNTVNDALALEYANHNLIENNTFSDNPVYGDGGQGITIFGCVNISIHFNTIEENNGEGIHIDNTSSDCLITCNDFIKNRKYGIKIADTYSNNIEIKCNNFIGNNFMGISQDRDSQGFDEGEENVFSGNYWDDWDETGNYLIDGIIANEDSEPVDTEIDSTGCSISCDSSTDVAFNFSFILLSIIALTTVILWRRKNTNLKC